jgi:uncharacterized protein (DUF1330 family)
MRTVPAGKIVAHAKHVLWIVWDQRIILTQGNQAISKCAESQLHGGGHPHEAGLLQRTAIVEFDSYEIALAAYDSEAYKKELRALGSGAERDFRIVEGV